LRLFSAKSPSLLTQFVHVCTRHYAGRIKLC
jgi:hypothetical protein